MAINPAIPVNGDDLDADPIRANFAAAAALETDYNAHKANVSNPHNVSAAQIGLGNVENKSSATIRGEITSGNVTTALGYARERRAEGRRWRLCPTRRHRQGRQHLPAKLR